jgi:hypothetical protein
LIIPGVSFNARFVRFNTILTPFPDDSFLLSAFSFNDIDSPDSSICLPLNSLDIYPVINDPIVNTSNTSAGPGVTDYKPVLFGGLYVVIDPR